MYRYTVIFSPDQKIRLLLQVWYAASYAEFVNQKVHDVTEEERKGKLYLPSFIKLVILFQCVCVFG